LHLYNPGFNSASNRNEYKESFLRLKGGQYVGLTTLPHSCADCLEISEPQISRKLRACPCSKPSLITTMQSKFVPFDSVLFIFIVGLFSLSGEEIISNFLTI